MANERRLIDGNDAVMMLRGKCLAKYPNTYAWGLIVAAREIEDMQTVDAVEVVRCKDCYKRNRVSCKMAHPHDMKDDDFCSFGERSEQ